MHELKKGILYGVNNEKSNILYEMTAIFEVYKSFFKN